MRITSWNVNGLRAVMGRHDLDWAFAGDLDVVCMQETKIQPDHVTDALKSPPGYRRSWWSFHAVKKGYSGTAIFVKDGLPAEPFAFTIGGREHPEYDAEGRIVAVDLGAFVLLTVYFPNGGSSDDRLAFKHAWHEAFTDAVVDLQKSGRPVVITGDFNVAHTDLDLAQPERWAGQSGCLPVERAWLDRLLAAGFMDTFRAEKGDLPRQFTFWETRVDARSDNQGWRIDYVVMSRSLEEHLLDAWISPQIFGSDHCPVGVELDIAGAGEAVPDPGDTEDAVDDDVGADEDNDDDDAGSSRWRR
jgi:exodeoxyribonuclease-3